jgi:hypothetical protein
MVFSAQLAEVGGARPTPFTPSTAHRDVVYLGGEGGCGVSANEYSCAHLAQINFGDLTLYLTYDLSPTLNYATPLPALQQNYRDIATWAGSFRRTLLS